MKQAVAIIFGCAMIGTTTFSVALDEVRSEMTVFGHKIAVLGPFNDERLVVDGHPLVKDAIVSIDRIDYVGGVGVLVGGASGDGNACDASPFIVSLVKGGSAKLDGPLDQCGMGEIEITSDGISILDPAFPNKPGHRHSWTPSGGLKDEGEVAFKPNAETGWKTVPRQGSLHPWDLYKNSEVNAAIRKLTGSEDKTFYDGLQLSDGGKVIDDFYVASGCVYHEDCASEGSFIIADLANKKVYIAWKQDKKPFVVRPPVNGWPNQFRKRLKDWTMDFN